MRLLTIALLLLCLPASASRPVWTYAFTYQGDRVLYTDLTFDLEPEDERVVGTALFVTENPVIGPSSVKRMFFWCCDWRYEFVREEYSDTFELDARAFEVPGPESLEDRLMQIFCKGR